MAMTAFLAIWWGTLFLAAFSVAFMVLLVIRRRLLERRVAAEEARVAELRPLIFRCLDNPDTIDEIVNELKPSDLRLMGPLVRSLINSVSGNAREILIELLKRSGVVEDDIKRLRTGTPDQRLQAAMTLAFFDSEEVVEALDSALDDSNIEVRIAAANVLLKINKPVDLGRILDWFQHHKGGFPRSLRNLFCTLVRYDSSAFLPHLDTVPAPALTALIYALGHTQDFSILPKLMRIGVNHASTDVRAETMRALGLIGHPAATPAISLGLANDSWEVRAQAAIAAGRIGLPRLLGTLAELLEDSEWWVRFRAAEAIGKMGDEGAQTLLDRSLGDSDGAKMARLALNQLGGN
ncbi:MAG: HEAT repeat domain-containing protein [Rhodospirillales bacterium]|jgi:HEAT repeat protein|nr:HEAT repeat domain-containing protein [Rhodospirillales bacterium]